MPRDVPLIRSLTEDPDVSCANCGATWSMPFVAEAHATRRLRVLGFAVLDLEDCLAVNYCPHCELQPMQREVFPCLFPWP